MLSANDARKISGTEGLERKLDEFERNIRRSAERGMRSALLCYCDSADGNSRAAMSTLESRGFEVYRDVEVLGGTRQAPGYYARW